MNIYEAEKLANELMVEHKLIAWDFGFDNAIRRFGYCSYTKRKISLSKPLVDLNNEEQVKDVILHEIAHAIAPLGSFHGTIWKDIARSIGCKATRCYSDEVIRPKGKYVAICKNGHESQRNKKPRRSRLIACGRCCKAYNRGKFSKEYLLSYRNNDLD